MKTQSKKCTPKECAYVRDNISKLTVSQMAKHLKRSTMFINDVILREGLPNPKVGKNRPSTDTQQDRDYIKANYLKKPLREIGRDLNRSHTFVRNVMRRNGWRRPKDVQEKFKNFTRFKNGCIPFNKGKAYYRPGMEKGYFKKGHKPHNTKPKGHIRKRENGYVLYKVANNIFVPYSHIVWQQHTGEAVPEGYMLIYKDGNSQNCNIENLLLITKAEHVKRNSIQRYPEHLRRDIMLLSSYRKKLKSIISKIQKNEK